MEASEKIKNNIKGLLKKYYEIEKELKRLEKNKYKIGDNSQEDIKSTELVLLWINIRSEIFYQRALLAHSYRTNL